MARYVDDAFDIKQYLNKGQSVEGNVFDLETAIGNSSKNEETRGERLGNAAD